ncbi:hypothetical protein C7S13_3785 [Burkholderia cepacia]|nr:hypothetical protein [Burkholderia cepacia]
MGHATGQLSSNYNQSGHGKHVDVGASGRSSHTAALTLGQTVGEPCDRRGSGRARRAFSTSTSISTDRRGYAVCRTCSRSLQLAQRRYGSLGFDTELVDNANRSYRREARS